MTITDRNAGYAGLKLGEAEFVLCVSFQIIWRRFFHAIWRIIRRTKDADSNDRTGFVVGICTEDRFGSVSTTAASPRREKTLEGGRSRCGHWIPDCSALDDALSQVRVGRTCASGSRDAATLDDAKEGAQKRKVFERGHAENE